MPGRIFASVEELKRFSDENGYHLIVTSGGFDPMHVGHLRCLQETGRIASKWSPHSRTAVIVNGDGFLMRKKGYAFMPEAERLEIIAGVEGVDFVAPWDDGGQTVTGALDILRPEIFTKGGDRDSAQNVPEFDLCDKIGCKVLFGIGGGKIQSSSDLVRSIRGAK